MKRFGVTASAWRTFTICDIGHADAVGVAREDALAEMFGKFEDIAVDNGASLIGIDNERDNGRRILRAGRQRERRCLQGKRGGKDFPLHVVILMVERDASLCRALA